MKKNKFLKSALIVAIFISPTLVLPVSTVPARSSLTITIQGGVGIRAYITNSGPPITGVSWTITATGGSIISPSTITGTFSVIGNGDTVKIKGIFWGFGTILSGFDNVVFSVTVNGVTVSTPPGPNHLFIIFTW